MSLEEPRDGAEEEGAPPAKKIKIEEENHDGLLKAKSSETDLASSSAEKEEVPEESENSSDKKDASVSDNPSCGEDKVNANGSHCDREKSKSPENEAEGEEESPSSSSTTAKISQEPTNEPGPETIKKTDKQDTKIVKTAGGGNVKKTKKKKRKKKIVKAEDEEEEKDASQRKVNHLRKNIKEIMKTESLGEETLAAQKEEAERRERMQQKLQQLKLLQAQALAARAKQEQEMRMRFMQAQNQTPPCVGANFPVPQEQFVLRPDYFQPLPQAQEEIVLSSDEEDQEKKEKDLTVQSQSDFALRAELNKPVEESIISLSSDDEEGRKFESTGRGGSVDVSVPVSGSGNESDDDCVLLSPTPDKEEEEKDERNMDELNVKDALGRVLVNVGHPEEDSDIFLAPQVARIVKPHQIGGIRFLYDNVVESVDRFNTASGFGCILAHSMGLGKTLQAVSFCDVFLRAAKAKTVLIIVPINTIQNWLNEFNYWLPSKSALDKKMSKKKEEKESSQQAPTSPNTNSNSNSTSNPVVPEALVSDTVSLNLTFDSTLSFLDQASSANTSSNANQNPTRIETDREMEDGEVHARNFEVYVLNETVKTLQTREKTIREWSEQGGILLIGYEMYRMLALKKLKRSKRPAKCPGLEEQASEFASLNNIHACLVNPGPDLVICDEGHRIKNSGASISQALKEIRTKRRVVLTGYPLQNNLMEYWCMVDFIRPNYLGSKVEFSNMFERPISNGQCVDSTPEDKRLMRFRSHVLHSLLEGFVQRRSHAVLHNALPPKHEWVFLLKMTDVQYRLYKEFLKYLSDNVEGQNCGANPIKAFAVCCKIWNHPDALYNVVKKKQSILDDLDLDEVTGGEKRGGRGGGRRKKEDGNNGGSPQIAFFDGSGFDFRRTPTPSPSTRGGGEALSLDWALPVFQNYVPGVLENGMKFEILFDIIQESLAVKDKILVFSQSLLSLDLAEFFLHQKFGWTKNEQYYRLDGSTTGLERERLINNFNEKKDVYLFIVSTRAGSLGINLTAANRVVVLDASWNPCHDCQAVCRIYRYGQTKSCQIYRFVSDCTLEKRIYDRQVNKRGMSDRVVDEMNPNAQFKSKDVSSFLVLKHDHLDELPFIKCDLDPRKYEDPILRNVLTHHSSKLTQEPFEHESLLIDQKSQRLSATEKRLAHRNYLNEKKTAELQSSSGYTYTRPSYAAYYPRGEGGVAGSVRQQPSSYLSTSSLVSTPSYGNGRGGRPIVTMQEDKFEHHVPALRAKGISVQSLLLKKDSFMSDPQGGPDMFLMAGEKIYVLRSEKGTYLRISNGKLVAVRNTGGNKFPELAVPPNQDLSKDQLHSLIYSFLKVPTGYDFGSSRSYSPFRGLPPEQPLPPSTSFFSQGKNHLQVTNTRNNSGGDVVLFGGGGSDRSNSPQQQQFSRPQSLSALLDSGTGGYGGPNGPFSSLEKLAMLAKFSPGGGTADEFSRSSHSNSPKFPFPGISPDFRAADEVEVIPLSQQNHATTSISTSSWPILQGNQNGESSSSGRNFYQDFTITVKNSKNEEQLQQQGGRSPNGPFSSLLKSQPFSPSISGSEQQGQSHVDLQNGGHNGYFNLAGFNSLNNQYYGGSGSGSNGNGEQKTDYFPPPPFFPNQGV